MAKTIFKKLHNLNSNHLFERSIILIKLLAATKKINKQIYNICDAVEVTFVWNVKFIETVSLRALIHFYGFVILSMIYFFCIVKHIIIILPLMNHLISFITVLCSSTDPAITVFGSSHWWGQESDLYIPLNWVSAQCSEL